MRILGLGLASLATFLAVFLLALNLHFPGEAARDRVAWELQQASGGEWLIQASPARLYRLTGLAMEDIVLLQAPKDRPRRGSDEEALPAIPVLRVAELAVRIKPLALLSGSKAATFEADLYGGSLSGQGAISDTTQSLQLKGRDIDLSRIPLEGEEWSVDATGMLRLDSDITLDLEDIERSEGDFELEVEDLVFQSATVMGMTLEPTPFSEATLAFKLDDGKAKVQKGRFESEPVDVTVDGEIALNKNLGRSRLRLELEVRFGEEFDRFAQMAPNLKRARDDEGVYHFRVSGTLEKPRFREQRQTVRSRTPPTRVGRDTPDRRSEPTATDEDAEARRQARRDRIKERREKMLDRRRNRGGDRSLPDELDVERTLPRDPPDRFDEEEFFDGDLDLDMQEGDFIDPEGGPLGPDDLPPDDLPPDEHY